MEIESQNKNNIVWDVLSKINVSKHVEKKKTGKKVYNDLNRSWEEQELLYIPFMSAWSELQNVFPNSNYEILNFDNGNGLEPWLSNKDLGYMVMTKVTINIENNSIARTCMLPVMDYKYDALKNVAYTYKTSLGKELYVNAANMFDINTAHQRCLVKNLALFGLGYYLYLGEDKPLNIDKVVENNVEINQLKQEIKILLETIPTDKLIAKDENLFTKLVNGIADNFNDWDVIRLERAIQWIKQHH